VWQIAPALSTGKIVTKMIVAGLTGVSTVATMKAGEGRKHKETRDDKSNQSGP